MSTDLFKNLPDLRWLTPETFGNDLDDPSGTKGSEGTDKPNGTEGTDKPKDPAGTDKPKGPEAPSGTTSISSTSLQYLLAKLELAQSERCKEKAEDYMEEIEKIQTEQKAVADMISRARQLQNKADVDGKNVEMPEDMVKFFEERDLAIDKDGNDNKHNKDEWTYNIESLTNYQQTISNKTQIQMVNLEDMVSQYNSFLSGASSDTKEASQIMQNLA